MTISAQLYPRGAEWRQWDLHVHTPASYEWNGGKRLSQMTDAERRNSMDSMIAALNNAQPAVFAIMDYWTFSGWFTLKARLAEPDAPKLTKTIFPGIELRLIAPMDARLNAHVVFADSVPDQDLHDFLSKLRVGLINKPLSEECLIRYAREHIQNDRMQKLGYDYKEVAIDDALALEAGSKDAQITMESYKQAIRDVPQGNAIGFMPWDTNDGLAHADWGKHYAYVLDLMQSSPIFETRKLDLWAAFAGVVTEGNNKWISAFQAALKNIARLAVSGSDAHTFADYGRFPNGRATWIKADPTFFGLQQAIKEPALRSFIGDRPEKLAEVASYKTFFIDQISVTKQPMSSITENWLHGCHIPLNTDLVAVIGAKGSGKSALADVIALLGDSRQLTHFSFLSKARFRAKPKDLARNFLATLTWVDHREQQRILADDPPPQAPEVIRYIPQAHFEKLCNDHVSGESDVFEQELRNVIFSHADASIKQGALDFDQLIDKQESDLRAQLGVYRSDLHTLNQEIESIESQLQPDVLKRVQELLRLKNNQIEELNKIKPEQPIVPADQLTPEQETTNATLKTLADQIGQLDQASQAANIKSAALVAKLQAIQSIRDRSKLLRRAFNQFRDDTAANLSVLGLTLPQVAVIDVKDDALNTIFVAVTSDQATLANEATDRTEERSVLSTEMALQAAKLAEPQQEYQRRLQALETWQLQHAAMVGDAGQAESLEGLRTRIEQLKLLPETLKEKQSNRLKLSAEIYDVLNAQREAREQLFKPVQDLIRENKLIRDDYRLQFQATLSGHPDTLSSKLFDMIKQNTGEFRGAEESFGVVRRIAEMNELNERTGILAFINDLHGKLIASIGDKAIGIASLLRKGRSATEAYDLLFGLSFLEPRYTLLFQDAQIAQLSPGQRGALLLIFYLLVDKGRTPIILDQPEENLDNETVVSLLVPVLTEAKRRRQIIMVTHNPNLAVVCDAEQIIYSAFDRKNEARIDYVSGSIENPEINRHVVNVLEGTKRAFNNRRGKYHQ